MKRLISLFMIILLLTFTGCGVNQEHNDRYFTQITEWNDSDYVYQIVYANDTHVKYLMVSGYCRFGITPLYNSDGTLQIY